MLLKRIRSLETEQEQSKKQSHALEGISMLVEAAKNLGMLSSVQVSSSLVCYC